MKDSSRQYLNDTMEYLGDDVINLIDTAPDKYLDLSAGQKRNLKIHMYGILIQIISNLCYKGKIEITKKEKSNEDTY